MEAATEAHVSRGRFVVSLVYPATLLVLSGYFVYGASIYETLPESIPTHWGPSGEPDAWSEKSFGSVFAPLIVALGLTVLMAFASAVVPAMSPPRMEASAWELYRREGMIRGTIAALGLTSLCLSLLCGMLSVGGWNSPEHLSAWPVLLFVVLLLRTSYGWPGSSTKIPGIHASWSPSARVPAPVSRLMSGTPKVVQPSSYSSSS